MRQDTCAATCRDSAPLLHPPPRSFPEHLIGPKGRQLTKAGPISSLHPGIPNCGAESQSNDRRALSLKAGQSQGRVHEAANLSQVPAEVLGDQKRHSKGQKKKRVKLEKRQGDRDQPALAKAAAAVTADYPSHSLLAAV